MKKWALALIAATMVMSLAACGSNNKDSSAANSGEKATEGTSDNGKGSSAEPVKLRIYAQYSDEDTKGPYDYAVAELKKEMPNVELDLDIQAQDDGQKLKTYAATGNLPDIFQVGLDLINTFKKSNNILQLDSYVEQLGFKDKVLPSAMNTLVTDDGHTYAFQYAGNEVAMLFYNKEIFEKNNVKVPTTYDEMMAAVKTFNANGITPMALFAKEKWPTVALFDMFASRSDAAGITKLDKGEAKASDPAFKQAAEEIVKLVKAGMLPKGATNLNYDQAAALFHEGKAAMFLNGQWEIAASTEALGEKLGFMYVPAPDAATYENAKLTFSGGGGPGGYAVNPSSKNVELAAKVAAFMAEKYAEFKFTQKGTPMVALKVDKPIINKFPPVMEQLAADIPSMKTTSFSWGLSNPKFKAAIEDASQSLMTGTYSADDFISDISSAIPSK
ncbi:ABC transporter substrate-binding protein [Paenibacillus glycanilyticus]|uniref:ABC transporter substrate-binding protein n=1 Tax=Paenibacillus glycanilyticus TaxID=126569 RepID=UPI0013E40C4B|nr:extracellular solute-binding protein [Paenibacillus glycanilyticus]